MLEIEARGMLFDMDGVLISSIASVNRCWRRWAVHYDVPVGPDWEIAHGTRAAERAIESIMEAIEILAPGPGSEPAAVVEKKP